MPLCPYCYKKLKIIKKIQGAAQYTQHVTHATDTTRPYYGSEAPLESPDYEPTDSDDTIALGENDCP